MVEESDCVEEVSGSDSDSLSDQDIFRVQTIGTVQSAGKKWYAGVTMKIPHTTDTNCKEIRCQIDTGSTCNLISESDCKKLVADSPMTLKKTKVLLKMYDGSIMKPLGSTLLLCKFGSVKQKIQFHVVPGKRTPLLSAETSEVLGLVTLNAPQEVLLVSKTTCEYQPLTKETLWPSMVMYSMV